MPSMDTVVLFYPRGGSAQVIRYLLRELNIRGWTNRLHAGSLGAPGDPSHGPSFYQGLDLRPYDYNDSFAAFHRGGNPQRTPLPFHPSYEDRGECPDPLFGAVPPLDADRLTRAWTHHLATHRSTGTGLVHLHHLSHLQTSVRATYPNTPVVTTLHGTELKLIDGMARRVNLAQRIGISLHDLARLLHTDNPHRRAEAQRIAKAAALDAADTELLTITAWQKWIHSPYWLTRLRQAVPHAGHLLAVSEHDRDLAQRLLDLDHELPVIPNGVDTRTFHPQQLDKQRCLEHLRHWLVTNPHGWAPGGTPGSLRYTDTDLRRLRDPAGNLRPLLLWVGRFLDFKRVPVLLRAFATARVRLDPAPVLLMWGGYPGEYEGQHPYELAQDLGIEDDVFFAGWRGHDELPTGLACADLMVAPAVGEPFGMIYLEAMACGTPPIATATGGPLHTIVPGGPRATGWLVKPDDPDDLADTLITALANTAERKRRGTNGRSRIENAYSWSRTADRYVAAYHQAAAH
ncbi:glycosyltransferase family 4 protein [Streptomyces sp. AV19]|uniref:glycosyltransferase family 4 protein n=1 Tax=Streptomyces sp. AV19 TaxID=2793068 RepID=UPI0018FE2310|nr:glycosyltransferase family 4 protein [Streptomyces sp. AV19]MBH1933279.1 glycosyltransferase family 4 protein [Streptomyces sp. AV19]MDG4536170.1 glycosyltransferase family 4 protein [Streptomyces sp. AV19]